MEYFRKWAYKRNPFLAFLCHNYAIGAPMAHRLLVAIRDERRFGAELTQPPLYEWLTLYKRHRLVRNSLIGFFQDPTGFLTSDKDIFEKAGQLIDDTPGPIPIHSLEEITNLFFNVSGPSSPLSDLQTFVDCPHCCLIV